VRQAAAENGKPVISTFLGLDAAPEALRTTEDDRPGRGSVPSYPSPERAVRAFGRVARHARWRRRDSGVVPELDGVVAEPARRLVEHVVTTSDGGARWLRPHEVDTVLAAFGLVLVPSRVVHGPWEARAAAATLGWPVALRHGDSVRLHLHDDHALADAWDELGLGEGDALVQEMAPRGVDTVFGIQHDRAFGALVSFGIGGLASELLGDRAFAVVPPTTVDAAELIRTPRAAPLLDGYRGTAPVDTAALERVALRLGRLAEDLPEVAELRLAPVVAAASGVYPLSCDIRLARPEARVDGPRRLRGL
jgi:acyl-CoA synthetase (NDP forming)